MGKTPRFTIKNDKLLHQYNTHLDINYLTVDGYPLKLDVYQRKTSQPNSTLIFIHGGGWIGGEKRLQVRKLIPYLEMGLSVVNIELRLHQALDQAEVNNQLSTILKGGHGQFNASEDRKINQTIQNFLRQSQLLN